MPIEFQRSNTTAPQFENILDTTNIIPNIKAADNIKAALLGCALINAYDLNDIKGEYSNMVFTRSLNTRAIDMRAIDLLMQNIRDHGLKSTDEDKCLHIFCREGDIVPGSLSDKWDIATLTPIRFSPETTRVQLANGSHRVHCMKIFKDSYNNRLSELQEVATEWQNESDLDAVRKELADNVHLRLDTIKAQRDSMKYWGVKVYDLGMWYVLRALGGI